VVGGLTVTRLSSHGALTGQIPPGLRNLAGRYAVFRSSGMPSQPDSSQERCSPPRYRNSGGAQLRLQNCRRRPNRDRPMGGCHRGERIRACAERLGTASSILQNGPSLDLRAKMDGTTWAVAVRGSGSSVAIISSIAAPRIDRGISVRPATIVRITNSNSDLPDHSRVPSSADISELASFAGANLR
jgi:hypothetical protein